MERRQVADSAAARGPWGVPQAVPGRCVAARHQASTCTACLDACPRAALGAARPPQVDVDACDGCGACVAACPAEALLAPDLADAIEAWLAGIASGAGWPASVRCERGTPSASPSVAALDVPCLGALRATDLVAARAAGAEWIRLRAPDCAGCDRAQAGALGMAAVAVARAALDALGAPVVVERTDVSMRPDIFEPSRPAPADRPLLSRRELFGLVRTGATRAIGQLTPGTACGSGAGPDTPEIPAWRTRLEADLARLRCPTTDDGLELPVALGLALPAAGTACDGCGLCAAACPFGAIAVHGTTLTAAPSRCIACGLCVDVCPVGALALRPVSPIGSGVTATGDPSVPVSVAALGTRARDSDDRMRRNAAARVLRPSRPRDPRERIEVERWQP